MHFFMKCLHKPTTYYIKLDTIIGSVAVQAFSWFDGFFAYYAVVIFNPILKSNFIPPHKFKTTSLLNCNYYALCTVQTPIKNEVHIKYNSESKWPCDWKLNVTYLYLMEYCMLHELGEYFAGQQNLNQVAFKCFNFKCLRNIKEFQINSSVVKSYKIYGSTSNLMKFELFGCINLMNVEVK